MEEQIELDYRGAIALNNIGVSLLEKGCYRDALDTLQDSIQVMKDLFRPSQSPQQQRCAQQEHHRPSQSQHSIKMADHQQAPKHLQQQLNGYITTSPAPDDLEHQVEIFLQRASRRLADPQPMFVPHEPHLLAHLESIPFDLGLTPVLNYLQETPSTTAFLPIRIDLPSDFSSLDPSQIAMARLRDIDIESSIILYNFGVTNFLISKIACSSPSAGERLRGNALSILHLASDVLSRRSSVCEDSLEEASLLQLGLLVVHATIQVLVEAGDDCRASIVCERYDRIRNAVIALQAAEWYGGAKKITAPAA